MTQDMRQQPLNSRSAIYNVPANMLQASMLQKARKCAGWKTGNDNKIAKIPEMEGDVRKCQRT